MHDAAAVLRVMRPEATTPARADPISTTTNDNPGAPITAARGSSGPSD
jgi:hypothetical protein